MAKAHKRTIFYPIQQNEGANDSGLLTGLSLIFILLLLSAVTWSAVSHFSNGGDLETWLGLGGFVTPEGTYAPTRTLWDWLSLLVLPAVLFITLLWIKREVVSVKADAAPQIVERKQPAENNTVDVEKELISERLREDALQSYFSHMTELLLERDLRSSPKGAEIRALARARTLTTMQALDQRRKSAVIRFLVELGLLNMTDPVISFEGMDLNNVSLPETKLNSLDLHGANLESADLSRADLEESQLSEADLRSADLRWANLSRANLPNANLSSARLQAADLSHSLMNEVKLLNADLSGANLKDALMRNADLQDAVLTKANLSGADLCHARLAGANLCEAILTRANLQHAVLLKADMRNADLTGADLKRADLTRANLPAILRDADLRWANMTEVNLFGADLKAANLRDADLGGAVLRDADLTDVVLIGANLANAVLEGAKVTGEQLKMTLSLENAVMPDGLKFDPDVHVF